MADIVFAFDAALDRPLPLPADAPPEVVAAHAAAPWEAFDAAVATARQSRAAALVLFGNSLDPLRASPAQAARLRHALAGLAADGCRTVWLADDATECANVARMLSEPAWLSFVTPVAAQRLAVRGLSVEICSARGPAVASSGAGSMVPSFASAHTSLLPAQRRVVVGWDDAWSPLQSDGQTVHHGLPAPLPLVGNAAGTLFVWGSRRVQALPAGVHCLPALQARRPDEIGAGACGLATLTSLPPTGVAAPALPAAGVPLPALADGHAAWREVPTHRVAWRTLRLESLAGDDEALADAIRGLLEGTAADPAGPLHVVRAAVRCGGSVPRRVHVGQITAETLAHLRRRGDRIDARIWCHEVEPDPEESFESLVRTASASASGTTASFASLLAGQVLETEQKDPRGAALLPREAAWLALELLEST